LFFFFSQLKVERKDMPLLLVGPSTYWESLLHIQSLKIYAQIKFKVVIEKL